VPLQSASQFLSIQRGFCGALCQQVWAKSDGQMVLGRIACTSFVDAAYCYTFRSVVSVLGTRVSCAKTDEPIASPLGADSCGPKNRVLNWVEIAMKGHFQPAVSYPPPAWRPRPTSGMMCTVYGGDTTFCQITLDVCCARDSQKVQFAGCRPPSVCSLRTFNHPSRNGLLKTDMFKAIASCPPPPKISISLA